MKALPGLMNADPPGIASVTGWVVRSSSSSVVNDAGIADAGMALAGIADAGMAEAGIADAGIADAGIADAGIALS
ncbi:MAG: hypothetical protein GY723_00745 [bacterium]|nr:hypothetical protein [bacterium]